MKAMLLAAGEGRRMLPLTADTPKPLLTVVDDTLIGHQLQRIHRAGITDVVINVAYLGQQIVDRLGTGAEYDVRIRFSRETEPLETAGGINLALPLLGDEPFVLVNGDVWCDKDLSQLAAVALEGDCLGHLVLVPNPDHNTKGDYGIRDGLLISAQESETTYTYSGLAMLSPQLIHAYPQRRAKFGLKEVFDWALTRAQLTAEVHEGTWLDVGTPERLRQLRLNVTKCG